MSTGPPHRDDLHRGLDSPEPISPELCLVCPELAAYARKRLPDDSDSDAVAGLLPLPPATTPALRPPAIPKVSQPARLAPLVTASLPRAAAPRRRPPRVLVLVGSLAAAMVVVVPQQSFVPRGSVAPAVEGQLRRLVPVATICPPGTVLTPPSAVAAEGTAAPGPCAAPSPPHASQPVPSPTPATPIPLQRRPH